MIRELQYACASIASAARTLDRREAEGADRDFIRMLRAELVSLRLDLPPDGEIDAEIARLYGKPLGGGHHWN